MIPFNIQMKTMMLTLLSLFFMNFAKAQQIQMDCSNNQCASSELSSANSDCASIVNKTQCELRVSANLCTWIDQANPSGGVCTALPQTKICSGYNCDTGQTMSVVKMRGILDKDLNVVTTQAGTPQNVGISVNAGAFPGKNASIALSAQNQTANAASVILVADNINNLNISLDGYSGKKGKSSAEICATKIKNGEYGVALQSYFNNRRSTTSADPNKCDADDLNYMQTYNFSCDDPSFTEVPSNDPTVQVSQVRKLARCSAVSSYNHCVKRKVNVTCNFRMWSAFRQGWMQNQYLANNSFVAGPTSCVNQMDSCGSVRAQCNQNTFYEFCQSNPTNSFCQENNQPYILSVTKQNSSGQFVAAQECRFDQTGNEIACNASYVNTTRTLEGFTRTPLCTAGKSPSMPLNRSLTILNVDEETVLSESARLGGLDKYCDVYAPKPAKSNQAWWGGAGTVPNHTGTVNGESSKETNGIPWEYMGAYSSSVGGANTPPAGNIPGWKDDTRINGGYEPNITYKVTGSISCPPENMFCSGTRKTGDWFSKNGYWKADSTSTMTYTSPGLNADGLTLATGSNWQVMQTNTFESCPAGWSLLKNIFLNLVQYTNKENTSCSGISDPQDPNNRAFWQYTGISQEASFGTEMVSCNIGACAVQSSVSDLARSIDVIPPASGENGTEQGRGLVFVYDIKNLSANSVAGGAGATGSADININPQTRICAKVDDANAGINTPQAKNPFVSFKRYNWQALKSTSGGNPGTPPKNTGKTVEVYKKLDPAARYLIDKSLL